MGYTVGGVPNAIYRSHGDHAETMQINFDPAKTSYPTLLEFFSSDSCPDFTRILAVKAQKMAEDIHDHNDERESAHTADSRSDASNSR